MVSVEKCFLISLIHLYQKDFQEWCSNKVSYISAACCTAYKILKLTLKAAMETLQSHC